MEVLQGEQLVRCRQDVSPLIGELCATVSVAAVHMPVACLPSIAVVVPLLCTCRTEALVLPMRYWLGAMVLSYPRWCGREGQTMTGCFQMHPCLLSELHVIGSTNLGWNVNPGRSALMHHLAPRRLCIPTMP